MLVVMVKWQRNDKDNDNINNDNNKDYNNNAY